MSLYTPASAAGVVHTTRALPPLELCRYSAGTSTSSNLHVAGTVVMPETKAPGIGSDPSSSSTLAPPVVAAAVGAATPRPTSAW